MTMTRTGRARLEMPYDEVDLGVWALGLSDAEYQACARGHRAAGVFADNGGRGSVNVESIGGNLIIQHYRAIQTSPSAVEMHSAASRVYLLHVIPVAASVRWWLAVEPTSDTTSELSCVVEVDLHPVLRTLGLLMGLGIFLRLHVEEETHGFAVDITRKGKLAESAKMQAST